MRCKLSSVLAAALLPFLTGCTMIPKYVRPAAPVPPRLAGAEATAEEPLPPDLPWQQFFTDERERAVIEQALANSRDLRIALLNVERARALYGIQRAELLPTVGVLANASAQRVPGKLTDDEKAYTSKQYTAALGITGFELDLFGRVRSLERSALEQYLATEQAGRAAKMALVAAVAQGYLTVAADADGLRLSKATLEAQQATLVLMQKSRDLGVTSDLELSQIQSQVEAARADVARYTALSAIDRNTLAVLVGAPVKPELLPDGLSAVGMPHPVRSGLASDVLLRRPDILAAEHQLRSANANIGAARAAFFPRITLTAGVGSLSPELSELLGAGTGTWSFAPQIVAPLFTGGANRARLKASKVDRQIAVAAYERVIQRAFAEVQDALTLQATLVEQQDAEEALVKALDATYRLSEARFKAGLDSYLGVLVAQRALFTAQQALVAVRLAEQANRVTLYKVLGGGA
jgi:outer membrane protein, multidrug efflux system